MKMVETYFSLPFTVMSLNSHKTYEDWKKAVANGTLERDFEEGMNKYLDSAYLLIFNGNSSSKLVVKLFLSHETSVLRFPP